MVVVVVGGGVPSHFRVKPNFWLSYVKLWLSWGFDNWCSQLLLTTSVCNSRSQLMFTIIVYNCCCLSQILFVHKICLKLLITTVDHNDKIRIVYVLKRYTSLERSILMRMVDCNLSLLIRIIYLEM